MGTVIRIAGKVLLLRFRPKCQNERGSLDMFTYPFIRCLLNASHASDPVIPADNIPERERERGPLTRGD